MKFQAGMVGAITGAGSGFGREMALLLAQRGVHLGLADINLAAADETVALCEAAAKAAGFREAKFMAKICDVGSSAQVFEFADFVKSNLCKDGKIDFVAANAGIGAATDSLAEPVEVMEKVMRINLLGVIYTSKAFLPMLIEQKRGSCLMLLSSTAGFMAHGRLTSYCASKFGVTGFGESLMKELRDDHPHVQVTLVHPSFCDTNIYRNSMAVTYPELSKGLPTTKGGSQAPKKTGTGCLHDGASAAAIMIRGVERGATRLLISPEAHLWDFMVRVAPRLAHSKAGDYISTVGASLAKRIGPWTGLTRAGVPSPGLDRSLFAAAAAAAAAGVAGLTRARL